MCSTPAIAGLTVQGASELPQVLVQNSDFWVPSWRLIQQVEGSPGIWILHKQLLMTDGGCFQTTPLARLPWWLRQKRVCLQCGRPGFDPWVRRSPGGRAWQPTSVFLPGESLWTEEPGGLQSMGLQRVRHSEATKHIAQWLHNLRDILKTTL